VTVFDRTRFSSEIGVLEPDVNTALAHPGTTELNQKARFTRNKIDASLLQTNKATGPATAGGGLKTVNLREQLTNFGSTAPIANSGAVKVETSAAASKMKVVVPGASKLTVAAPKITLTAPKVDGPAAKIRVISPKVAAPKINVRPPKIDPKITVVPSDVRLKRDIVQIGQLANGLHIYRYRYLWDDTLYVGVMAQEVAVTAPEAVVRGEDGYLRVAYDRLGLRLMTWAGWLAANGDAEQPRR
jgi:hypothetical protein